MERRFKTANDNSDEIDNNSNGAGDFSLSEEERRFKVIRDVGQPYFFNLSDDGSDLSGEEKAETSLTSSPAFQNSRGNVNTNDATLTAAKSNRDNTDQNSVTEAQAEQH